MLINSLDDLKGYIAEDDSEYLIIRDEKIKTGNTCQKCGDIILTNTGNTFSAEFLLTYSEDDIVSFIESESGKMVFIEDDINICDCKDSYDYDEDEDYFYSDNEEDETLENYY